MKTFIPGHVSFPPSLSAGSRIRTNMAMVTIRPSNVRLFKISDHEAVSTSLPNIFWPKIAASEATN